MNSSSATHYLQLDFDMFTCNCNSSRPFSFSFLFHHSISTVHKSESNFVVPVRGLYSVVFANGCGRTRVINKDVNKSSTSVRQPWNKTNIMVSYRTFHTSGDAQRVAPLSAVIYSRMSIPMHLLKRGRYGGNIVCCFLLAYVPSAHSSPEEHQAVYT